MAPAQAIPLPRLILALLLRTFLMIAVFVVAAAVEAMIAKDFPPDCGRLILQPTGAEIAYRTLTWAQILFGTAPAVAAALVTYATCRAPLMSWRSTQGVSIAWAVVAGLLILFLGFKFPLYVC